MASGLNPPSLPGPKATPIKGESVGKVSSSLNYKSTFHDSHPLFKAVSIHTAKAGTKNEFPSKLVTPIKSIVPKIKEKPMKITKYKVKKEKLYPKPPKVEL